MLSAKTASHHAIQKRQKDYRKPVSGQGSAISWYRARKKEQIEKKASSRRKVEHTVQTIRYLQCKKGMSLKTLKTCEERERLRA